MDVIDFPFEPRRSIGPRVTANGATASDTDRRPSTCLHDRIAVGRLVLDLCPDTDEATWLDGGAPIDPSEALAHLFGNFDLEAALPALRSPGEVVLVYRPDGRRGRAAARSLPPHRWVEGAPGLWLTQDGDRLLMSPVDPLLAENLMRDL